ncbi:MAG: hypothetical protein HYY30_05455 [Chloroflexi bacterium]|nr:hypothetical protein [Chloroflexota bacterium]
MHGWALFGKGKILMFMAYGTRTYGYPEITGWLSDAGFGDCKRTDLPFSGGVSIVSAMAK